MINIHSDKTENKSIWLSLPIGAHVMFIIMIMWLSLWSWARL